MTRFDQYLTKRANFRKKNKGFINFLSKQDMEVDEYIIICLLLEKFTQKKPKNVEVDKIVSELALSSAWLPKSALSALMVRNS